MSKKLVVITGASSGFGLELAKEFAAQGYPMLLLARRIDGLQAYNFKNTLIKSVDVTDYTSFQAAIAEAEALYGKTDLLVNNAGIMLLGSLLDQNPDEWQSMLNVNVMGVLNGIQLVIKNMVAANTGTIVNVSSIAGRKTFPNHAAYCGTKFAVHALTETVRQEVALSNVRVLTIAPGAAETELLSHTTSQEIIDGYNEWKETMGGKSLDPKYIASSVRFMYELPQEVSIRELVISATRQDA
ncbi:SDR family oxidoreductase [Hydromonas duriensis]|nr:SDR family oxidoreductase [Hydromonas duriensis]